MAQDPDVSKIQRFIENMDLGFFDGKLNQEIDKLSSNELQELAELLMQRSSRSGTHT